MTFNAEQQAQFERDGVLPLGAVIEPELASAAHARVDELIAAGAMDSPTDDPSRTSFRLLNASSTDDWFRQIVLSERVLDAAELALGPNVQYFQDNLFCKPSGNGASTRWHQDNVWWGADPPHMVTIWIALEPVDEENGAVRYIPGSHESQIEGTFTVHDPKGSQYNLLADDQVDADRAVAFSLGTGHAVMHHCLTIHGAPPNESLRSRRGYTVHLMEAGLLGPVTPQRPLLRGSMPAA
jgi:ectoine hydroxylase-related dioxygenase (phytanoyl-CoA dioxygenase family)